MSAQASTRLPAAIGLPILPGMAKDRDEPASRRANKLTAVREDMMISKAELARRAGVSALTVNRIEDGENCRMDTKRKIILALGLKINEMDKVFATEVDQLRTVVADKRRRR